MKLTAMVFCAVVTVGSWGLALHEAARADRAEKALTATVGPLPVAAVTTIGPTSASSDAVMVYCTGYISAESLEKMAPVHRAETPHGR